jgi:putative intracellular protease/amidase
MSKKIAVLVVNPVNGMGLFQYLEAFFENGISYKTFAVAETNNVKTNSGVCLQTDAPIANLKGCESDYDALVFACGDAMPKYVENIDRQYNKDMTDVIKNFYDRDKILVGHCVAGLLFGSAGAGKGKRVAVHPFCKAGTINCIPTDAKFEIDGNLYTAQTEATLPLLLPDLLKILKE